MTLDTIMTSTSVPAANKKRTVMAFKPFTKAGAKDPGEPDADDKKAPKPKKKGAFKAAYSAKFGKG